MPSSSPEKSHQHQYLLFEVSKPHFFKVVLDDAIRDRKLGIPRKFVRKYGNNLPGSTVLKVPSGENWQVQLLKCDGEIWLKDGWPEFVEFYSIIHGSFLIFEYDQRSGHFNVIIFDQSATEIDYPYGSKDDNEEPNKLEKHENHVSFKTSDEFMPCWKIKEESTSPLPMPCRKMKPGNPTVPYTRKKRKLDNSTRKSEGNNKEFHHEKASASRKQFIKGPIEDADKFASRNPFFKVVVQSSHLIGSPMSVPLKFMAEHAKRSTENVALQVQNKRWSVKLLNYGHRGMFSAGLSQFVRETSLQAGDVCILELINDETKVLKVYIYRNDN